jgi:hypothetical protein
MKVMPRPNFCNVCGKELVEMPPQTFTNGFNVYTGKQIVIERRIFQCPDYKEVYITELGSDLPTPHYKDIRDYQVG